MYDPTYMFTGYISLRNTAQSQFTKTPSVAAQSASFWYSQGKEHLIFDGQHSLDSGGSTIAMPTSLYPPVFRWWCIRAADPTINVPPLVIAVTARLMEAASFLYPKEKERKNSTRSHFQNAISHGIQHILNSDDTSADGWENVAACRGGVCRNVPVLINEEKHDSADSFWSNLLIFSLHLAEYLPQSWMLPDLPNQFQWCPSHYFCCCAHQQSHCRAVSNAVGCT